MKCLVCSATSAAERPGVCPQCGYDASAPSARDPQRIAAARAHFRERTTAYAPDARVTRWDKAVPWLGVLLGLAIFVFLLRACATGGFRVW